MFKLQNTLNALSALSASPSDNDNFKRVFKAELAELKHSLLPLQQGLSQSSYVSDEKISAVILNVSETDQIYKIKTSIFYTGIIAGCSCADDPTPQDTQNEQCDILLVIDKLTAKTTAALL